MSYRFCLNPVSYHGFNAIENIAVEAKTHHFKKALVVTDESLVKFHVVDHVLKVLDNASETKTPISPNTTTTITPYLIRAFLLMTDTRHCPQSSQTAMTLRINQAARSMQRQGFTTC